MAKTAAATAPAPVAAAAPTPKKSKLIWIVLAVVLLGGGGGAGWYLLRPAAAATADAHAKAAPERAPVFMTLDPFTVNLAEESGDHYLQVGIVYQVTDEKAVESIKLYMPVLRNRILLLLSAKHPSDIAASDGKRKLVDELVAAARESLPGAAPDKGVVGALLSSFVIQ